MDLKVKIQLSYQGKTYSIGNTIKDCSAKDAKQLIETGFAEKIVKPTKTKAKED